MKKDFVLNVIWTVRKNTLPDNNNLTVSTLVKNLRQCPTMTDLDY